MKKQLNEQFIRMQKLAGIITENLNEAITLDPNKLKAFTMAVNAFGGSRGDKTDFLKIAKLLSSNQLAKAADAINMLDTSPTEWIYERMMDIYPELWDILFDNEKGSYIALARPKADLPENISNMAKRNFPKEQNAVVNSYLNMLRDLESKQTDDEDDLKNLAVAIGLYEKELLAKIKNI